MRLDRLGKFSISMKVITGNGDEVRKFMGNCIIIRAEMMYAEDEIQYTAHSHLFDKIERGDRIPEYDVTVSRTGDGNCDGNCEFSTRRTGASNSDFR